MAKRLQAGLCILIIGLIRLTTCKPTNKKLLSQVPARTSEQLCKPVLPQLKKLGRLGMRHARFASFWAIVVYFMS